MSTEKEKDEKNVENESNEQIDKSTKENGGDNLKESDKDVHKKEHHKKKFQTEIDKIEKLSKEEIIEEYIKLFNDNEKLTIQAEEKEKESTEYLDRYRRSLAEVENVRRRLTAEKQDFIKYANFNIVSDLLTILDDFQRAIDTANAGKVDFDNYKSGIEMIEKQFIDLLFKKYGVVKFGESGEEFDPSKHQAVLMEEGEFEKEQVIEVLRNGYSLHERVIRPSQVKIGRPKE
jgi:molecular chaperone GrpE